MPLIFVYITNPTGTEAKRIARHLIKKKLIVCANIFPIESIYPWKGKIANEKYEKWLKGCLEKRK